MNRQTSKITPRWAYSLFVSLLLTAGTAGSGHANEVPLFRDTRSENPLSTEDPQGLNLQDLERVRTVDLNVAVLSAKSPSRIPQVIHFNLFDDLSLIAYLEEIDWRSVDHYTWIGTVPGYDPGHVILVVEGYRIAANLYLESETYQVRPPPAVASRPKFAWPLPRPTGRSPIAICSHGSASCGRLKSTTTKPRTSREI